MQRRQLKNPPSSPFYKGGLVIYSHFCKRGDSSYFPLWQRGVGEIFMKLLNVFVLVIKKQENIFPRPFVGEG